MSIWDKETDLTKMLEDMGFEKYDNVPSWAIELASNLIDVGWKKP